MKKMMSYNKFLPLRQRISVAYHLKALSKNDAYQYFDYHIKRCGANTKIFLDNAIETIITASKGVPRVINTLALKSMYKAVEQKGQTVDQEYVMAVMEELGMR